MLYTLIFCQDGCLRVKYGAGAESVPLSVIQEHHELSDLVFLSYWGEIVAIFEKGLTISSFLKCIEPWTSFFSAVTGKDLKAYMAESKKPILAGVPMYDWISLSLTSELSPELKFNHAERVDAKVKLSTLFEEPEYLPRWNLDHKYSLAGYKLNDKDWYSVDSHPLNKLANIPLTLETQHVLWFNDTGVKSEDPYRESPFLPTGFGINQLRHSSDDTPILYARGSKEFKFGEIVTGFFQCFCYNPEERETLNKKIDDALSELDELGPELRLVAKDDDGLLDSSPSSDSDNFEEDAGGLSTLKAERAQWLEILNKAKSSDTIIKIGAIVEAVPPMHMFMSFQLPPE